MDEYAEFRHYCECFGHRFHLFYDKKLEDLSLFKANSVHVLLEIDEKVFV